MAFNYNHLSTNPMHALMPSLIGNLANGNGGFLPPNMQGNPANPGVSSNGDDYSGKASNAVPHGVPSELEMRLAMAGAGGGGAGGVVPNGPTAMKVAKLDGSVLEDANKHPQNGLYNGGIPQNFMMLSRMMAMDQTMMGMQAAAAAAQYPMFSQMPPPPTQLTTPVPPPLMQTPQQAQQQQQQTPPQLIPGPHQAMVSEVENGLVSAGGQHLKELITSPSCTLFPPNPTVPPPTTRERPPGCRTVFVGGLPENVTEEIIREVFDRCGEITTLRLSKKNFCHIRFAFEASVDSAIYLSGYRMRINNQSDAANCGRLHVDYAQARDDQYEYECKQRQVQREMRHRERVERDRLRPSSPPLIGHYTEHEAGNVSEKLKQDESFAKAVQTLITWLERGDCSKKNSNTFYTMIQSTNAHVRRLSTEKQACEEEWRKAKEVYKKHVQSMVVQFNQIKKVFNAASHKKVNDHMTKAQRKNIEAWKRQVLEMRMDSRDDHEEDEMEMSDDDRAVSPVKSTHSSSGPSLAKRTKLDNDSLKEENDSLKCQLQVYKNEVDLVKSDLKTDTDLKDQQIKVLQETIRNMQTQLLENKSKERDLEEKLKSANVKELLLKTKIATSNASANSHHFNGSTHSESEFSGREVSVKCERVDSDDARIISLVSALLVVHPMGVPMEGILSYLSDLSLAIRKKDLEEILVRYSGLFLRDLMGNSGIRKWKYIGFASDSDE